MRWTCAGSATETGRARTFDSTSASGRGKVSSRQNATWRASNWPSSSKGARFKKKTTSASSSSTDQHRPIDREFQSTFWTCSLVIKSELISGCSKTEYSAEFVCKRLTPLITWSDWIPVIIISIETVSTPGVKIIPVRFNKFLYKFWKTFRVPYRRKKDTTAAEKTAHDQDECRCSWNTTTERVCLPPPRRQAARTSTKIGS